jgi:hypothetical protein
VHLQDACQATAFRRNARAFFHLLNTLPQHARTLKDEFEKVSSQLPFSAPQALPSSLRFHFIEKCSDLLNRAGIALKPQKAM